MAQESRAYTLVAIILHWVSAVLIVGQIVGGLYMVNLSDQSPAKFEVYQLHKSFGLTILFVSLLRLFWRLTHRPPALPDGMAAWERAGARVSHIGFYILLICIPLIGWAVVSASPLAASIPTYIFGVLPWPHLPFFEGAADRESLTELLGDFHKFLAFAMIGLLVVHVGAALKHHAVNRDDVLARMAPIFRRRSS